MRQQQRNRGKGCLIAFLITCFVITLVFVGGLVLITQTGVLNKIYEKAVELQDPIDFQEITIPEESLTNKYYYKQLNADEQLVYKEIVQGIRDYQPEIYLHTNDAENVNRIFNFVLYDMPDIFWCDGNAMTTGYEGAEEYSVLQINYTYDKQTVETRNATIEAAAQECLAGIDPAADEYQKIKYVYDYVINTVEYDLEAPDNQNICSVFLGKRSVCAGYARAVQYLLEKMNIFATYVTGTSTNKLSGSTEDHAWNLVLCDGEYYYVDATWGDPVFNSQDSEAALQNLTVTNYDYLLSNEEQLFITHTLSGEAEMPPCTSNAYNYYILNGMYYDQLDEYALSEAMNTVIEAQGSPVIYKFANNDLYTQAYDLIINNLVEQSAQYLMELYGKQEVNYYYQEDPELNKLVIYWVY